MLDHSHYFMEGLVQVYFFTIPNPILFSHIDTQSNVCALCFLRYGYNLIKMQWSRVGYVNAIVLWRLFVYNAVVCLLHAILCVPNSLFLNACYSECIHPILFI